MPYGRRRRAYDLDCRFEGTHDPVFLRIFYGVRVKKLKDRVLDSTTKDKKGINDWMASTSGGKLLGAILVPLGIWTVVRVFWS